MNGSDLQESLKGIDPFGEGYYCCEEASQAKAS